MTAASGDTPVDRAVARATTVPALLRALVASDPGRPRITWYDDAAGPTRGERIELSARVLANWVAKAANLLVDELDVEAGDRVLVDLRRTGGRPTGCWPRGRSERRWWSVPGTGAVPGSW